MLNLFDLAELVAERFTRRIIQVAEPKFDLRKSIGKELFVFLLNLPRWEGDHQYGDSVLVCVNKELNTVELYTAGTTPEKQIAQHRGYLGRFYTKDQGQSFTIE